MPDAQRDKTVLITGAGRGLGAALAREFGRPGSFVYVNYRSRRDSAETVLAEVIAAGGAGELLALDVRDGQAVDKAVENIVRQRGAIDVLVNNAGVASDAYFVLMDERQWRQVFDTNVHGTFNMCRAVLPHMLARHRGSIINMASVAALRASPGQSNYAAAKSAVLAFTRTLAVESAAKGVRVNALVPGLMREGLTARLNREASQRWKSLIPMGDFGSASDVAAAAAFLASDKAGYITGQAWVIDGGLSC